jgi:hypothetical protein
MKEGFVQGKIAHIEPMGNIDAAFVVKRGDRIQVVESISPGCDG